MNDNKYIHVTMVVNREWFRATVMLDHITHVFEGKEGLQEQTVIVLSSGAPIIVSENIQAVRNKIAGV